MPLTDGDLIRGLLATYCERIDAGDFAGVGGLFARATLADESGTPIAAGADEVAAFYRSVVRLHDDGTPRTQHLVLNTRLEEPADGRSDRLIATSAYVVLQAVEPDRLTPLVTGSYVDTFARDSAGAWHFSERRVGIRLAGDLSQHLRIDLDRKADHE